jgi:hypothetical protein
MTHTRHIIFLLLFVISSTTPNIDTSNSPSDKPKSSEKTINNENLKKSFHQKKNPKIFTEEDVAEMELVFKNSPKKAQNIVDHLKKCIHSPYHQDNKLAIFFGDSESDNKEMAQAIAYRMYQQGWNIEIFSGESLFGKNSDHTAIKLANALNNIETLNEPTLIVFFDLDQPLAYHHDQYRNPELTNTSSWNVPREKSHYAELTNIVFWNFLHRQRSNEKLFLIGTMNDIQELPKDTKNNIIMNIIEFPSHS